LQTPIKTDETVFFSGKDFFADTKSGEEYKSEPKCIAELKTAAMQGGVINIFTPAFTFSDVIELSIQMDFSDRLQWMTRTNRNEKCTKIHSLHMNIMMHTSGPVVQNSVAARFAVSFP
jgi:hypothetical protein